MKSHSVSIIIRLRKDQEQLRTCAPALDAVSTFVKGLNVICMRKFSDDVTRSRSYVIYAV